MPSREDSNLLLAASCTGNNSISSYIGHLGLNCNFNFFSHPEIRSSLILNEFYLRQFLFVSFCFKDVVFKLWYKYLQVTGSAFTGSPDGTLPSKSSVFYWRDAELLGKNKRKRRQKKADADDEEDDLELCSHFSDEEFYEGKRGYTSAATFPKNRDT